MSFPDPPVSVMVPYFYYYADGSNKTRVDVPGLLRIKTVTTFAWGDYRLTWELETVIPNAPEPPPTGGPWFGPRTNLNNAERYRINTSAWVSPTGTSGATSIWGTTAGDKNGAFRIRYPDTLVNISSNIYTYNDPALTHYIWPPDVLPPGVDVDNPVRFTAKPMSSARGALRTIIDGGSL